MQNEEIKRALEICSTRTDLYACEECYCHKAGLRQFCHVKLKKDALTLIKSLEARVAELTPPVEIGDTVKCACEELDEYGNPTTVLVPYKVYGVLRMGDKWYERRAFSLRELLCRRRLPAPSLPTTYRTWGKP